MSRRVTLLFASYYNISFCFGFWKNRFLIDFDDILQSQSTYGCSAFVEACSMGYFYSMHKLEAVYFNLETMFHLLRIVYS